MSALEVVTPPTLDELAATIRREHDLVLGAGVSIIQHAVLAGDALLAARAQVPRGQWLVWLDTNWEHESYAMAAYYMRIARSKAKVMDAAGIKEAIKRLAGQSRVFDLPTAPYASEIRELRAEGVPVKRIAAAVGISPSAVYGHLLSPEERRARKRVNTARAKAKRAERKAAEKALERQQRDAAMKKAGGDAWDAYVLIRKVAPVLDRMGATSAYAKCVALEDDLVKLVRNSP